MPVAPVRRLVHQAVVLQHAVTVRKSWIYMPRGSCRGGGMSQEGAIRACQPRKVDMGQRKIGSRPSSSSIDDAKNHQASARATCCFASLGAARSCLASSARAVLAVLASMGSPWLHCPRTKQHHCPALRFASASAGSVRRVSRAFSTAANRNLRRSMSRDRFPLSRDSFLVFRFEGGHRGNVDELCRCLHVARRNGVLA